MKNGTSSRKAQSDRSYEDEAIDVVGDKCDDQINKSVVENEVTLLDAVEINNLIDVKSSREEERKVDPVNNEFKLVNGWRCKPPGASEFKIKTSNRFDALLGNSDEDAGMKSEVEQEVNTLDGIKIEGVFVFSRIHLLTDFALCILCVGGGEVNHGLLHTVIL